RARWADLGVAGPALDLDPSETITARTFVTAPEPSAAPISISSLPRISLATPSEPAGAPGGDGVRADIDVTGVLREGGAGRVLLAHQRSLRRDVAVKVIKAESDDGSIAGSLLTEAVITGSLEHPGVVPVHALGRGDDERPVLVMKRIEGVSWRDLARDP